MYYKVCKVLRDGRLVSFTMPAPACVTYGLGSKAEPKGGAGPLCVFSSKAAVSDFLVYTAAEAGGSVFECEADNAREPVRGTAVWAKSRWMLADALPKGTLLADSVTLTRELTEEELSS